MRLAVTGGKGGTGKSLIATSIAMMLSEKNSVQLIDADVECPNDHLLLSIKREQIRKVYQFKPVINPDKCVKCGLCVKTCREKALFQKKGEIPILIPEECIGCKACQIVCPNGAIESDERLIGRVYKGSKEGLSFLSAEIIEGVEEASPVVNALKKEIKTSDYEIIDTAAGTHCTVIAALLDADKALIVAEPTPLSCHDAELMIKLLKELKVPASIVINKSTIGDKKLIKDLAKKYSITVIGEVPYSEEIIKSYAKGEPIVHESIKELSKTL